MTDMLRSILSATFGWRWVTLIDHEGDRNVRRVRWRGGRAFACRLSFGIRDVWLLDDGKLENGSWVTRWEPYEPGAGKVWPSYRSGSRA